MKWILIRWLSLTAAILATSYLLNGIHVSGFFSAFLAAAALGILNAFFRPIAFILTLPLNILTLGLFTFVLNAAMLKLASGLISGFEVEGFWTAVGGALLISLISWILNSFVHENSSTHDSQRARRYEDDTIDLDHKGDDRWE
jgi:putative membrane protein